MSIPHTLPSLIRLFVICASVLQLASCGGQAGGNDPDNGTQPTGLKDSGRAASVPSSWIGRKPSSTLSQTISQLESTGKLPILDRSNTLAGLDSNQNGIRDDIDKYINTLGVSAIQKPAVEKQAAAIQMAVTVDTSNRLAVNAAATALHNANICLIKQFQNVDASTGKPNSVTIGRDLEKYTANTKLRLLNYLRFNKALDGTTIDSTGGVCV